MMLCKADFEELFPDLFPENPAPAAKDKATEACDSHAASADGPPSQSGRADLILAGAVAAHASANTPARNGLRAEKTA